MNDKQLYRKYEGRRVRLLPNDENPEEFGTVIEVVDGELIVSVDLKYRRNHDDGVCRVHPSDVEFVQPNIMTFFSKPLYVQTLFDPVQTHAVYGVRNDEKEIERVKTALKSIGANRFRVVKNEYGMAIVCFKIKLEEKVNA